MKNKEVNLRETAERLHEAQGLLNMRLRQGQYKDPSDQLDPHKPARTMNVDVPHNVMKNRAQLGAHFPAQMASVYFKKVKKHLNRSVERDGRMAQTTDAFNQLIAM